MKNRFKTNLRFSAFTPVILLAGLIALISVLIFFSVVKTDAITSSSGISATDSVGTSGEEELLQFTSAGHVLGFSKDGVIIASARHMLRVNFLNSRAVVPKADDAVSGETNTGKVFPLNRVIYQNVWDGVTVVYEANQESVVKSTYYVNATKEGVFPVDRIRLNYNRPIQIDEKGNLFITYEDGIITEAAPVAWQETEGGRNPVAVSYILYGEREVGFSLGDYIPGIPVVIDPTITWNTFLGGSDLDSGYAITVDGSGNVYVVGSSGATWGSPVRAYTSGDDAFAAKFDSSGNLVWNTFLGTTGSDYSRGISVDGSNGNVYVAGYSDNTWGTPVRAYTSATDAWAAKLDSSGNLAWNTFLGGSSNDSAYGIAVDGSNGNVYVAGTASATWGTPVRAYTSGSDTFAAKLDSSGNLAWNTFLGGSGTDNGRSITVDGSNGNVYVAGDSTVTWGTPVRAYTSGSDTFAAKLDSSGNLAWNTFLGGSGTDPGYGIAVDSSGNIYVVGYSNATWGTPVRAYTSSNDIVATKLNSNGFLQWNTFLGDSGADSGWAIAVDGSGNIYVVGYSNATWGTPVRAYYGSGQDAYAAKLDDDTTAPASSSSGSSGSSAGPTIVTFSGKAFPDATIIVVDKNIRFEEAKSQNIVTDDNGAFQVDFIGISQGKHSIGLIIKDKDNRSTQTKFFTIDTLGNDLTVKDILVPPTIGLLQRTVGRGQATVIVGNASPNNSVILEIDDEIKKEVNVEKDGSYRMAVDTGALEFGTHHIRAKQIDSSQERESEYSLTNDFIVSRLILPKTDLSGDGVVNIKDWSMFLSNWGVKDKNQKKMIDFNEDGKVDVSDFSIFIRAIRK